MTAEKLMRARCNNKKDESLYPIASIQTSQNAKEYIGSKKSLVQKSPFKYCYFLVWFKSFNSFDGTKTLRYRHA